MISLIELMGTTQKMKFSIKDFFSNLVTFSEEIFNGKLNFLSSGGYFRVSLYMAYTWPFVFVKAVGLCNDGVYTHVLLDVASYSMHKA